MVRGHAGAGGAELYLLELNEVAAGQGPKGTILSRQEAVAGSAVGWLLTI